jgi:hypothetical protein
VVAGEPVQVIAAKVDCTVPLIDLRELEEGERAGQVRQVIEQAASHRFDLERGPLLCAWVLRLAEQEHVLLLTMHHIVSDGWSTGLFVQELRTLYEAGVKGEKSPLPEVGLHYADYAVWQRNWLRGEVLERQVRYWTEHLQGVQPLALPTDHPRPALASWQGAHQEVVLAASLQESLQEVSRREGVTLFMTLLAAFQVLLARYSGQSDIAVGTLIANRTRAELERVMGFFVNTLVMRTDLSGNPQFKQVLSRVREVALGAYAHQEVPFEKVVEVLQPKRDLSRSPLFQVMFTLQNTPRASEELVGLTLSHEDGGHAAVMYDFSLVINDTPRGLRCILSYNTDLFESETIIRLLGHWEILLKGIVAHPEWKLSELPLLTETERQRVLVEWNSATADYPTQSSLPVRFETQVSRTPDSVAVVCQDAQLTYAELNQCADHLAHYLREIGPGISAR